MEPWGSYDVPVAWMLKIPQGVTGLAVRNPKGDGGQATTDDFELSLGDPEGTYISVSLAG